MSLSDLVSGGAGCGPSNPLQNMGKRFGQDRGSQLDSYSHAASSSSQQQHHPSFRSSHSNPQLQNPDFFNTNPQFQQQPQQPQDAFDLSQLRGNLPFGPNARPAAAMPHIQGPAFARQPGRADLEASFRASTPKMGTPPPPQASASSAPAWASDFLNMNAQQQTPSPPLSHQSAPQQHANMAHHHPMQPMAMGMGMGIPFQAGAMQHMNHQMPINQSAQPLTQSDAAMSSSKWHEAFTAVEASRNKTPPPAALASESMQAEPAAKQAETADPYETDELARTAGRLVSSVEHDQSTKFRQSNFLDLMRRIRDKQASIQGTDIVEHGFADGELASDKGKGKARDMDTFRPQSQQEAYDWAKEMAATGQSSKLPPSMQRSLGQVIGLTQTNQTQPMITPQQEIANRQAINDLWAEEDARSEAIEREAMQERMRAFAGDGGDVQARMREDDAEANEFAKYQRLGANIPHASTFRKNWEEDMNQADQQTEEDFVGRAWQGRQGRGVPGAQTAEWDKLQSDWDNFEVTSAGIRPVNTINTRHRTAPQSALNAPSYRFLSDNPYIASSRHHAAHSGSLPAGLESVLEREAAVQEDPNNASVWYDLGVKQQENERETQAIAALQKAIQLNPDLKDAWLALAVSYTNENDRTAAYEAIEHWTEIDEKYRDIVAAHKAEAAGRPSATLADRHANLTTLLIAMARHGSQLGEVDADVQVALGVLFNGSEDYDKAVDCFSAALSVRPQDWLLYNRLGATLSNSGRSDEAIGYYHHALNLQPEFVRCHFNLSISCLNLKMYQDAAEHIFTALTLQQAERETLDMASPGDPNRPSSATSGSLWETFRVALELLNRPDLASKCATRDVNAFDPNDLVPPANPPADDGMDGMFF